MFEPLRLKIFTWHIHGSYLYYLSQGNYDIYIPVTSDKQEGYYGRGETFPFGANVIEVEASEVKNMQFDCILFQTSRNYITDQYDILSTDQQTGPQLFLQHDPPWGHPTDSKHIAGNGRATIVHVTHFNALMWDNGTAPVRVIEHGIKMPETSWKGSKPRGIVMVNNFGDRGRLLGLDLFLKLRELVPLDLIGMDTERIGGLGEVLHPDLPDFLSDYRFFFNPIRYTSLGLSVLEAMHLGLPVVGLATTEMVTTIINGSNGYLHTDPAFLVSKINLLVDSKEHARELGTEAKKTVSQRFNIARFTQEWEALFKKTAMQDILGEHSLTI